MFFALCAAAPAAAEPMQFDNGRLFVAATINGAATEALLDSGAEASLVDPALAARANLPEGQPITIRGSGGSASARLVQGVTIDALGQTLRPEAVVVMDLADISKRLVKRPLAMVLGREIFDSTRLWIDIEGGEVRPLDRTSEPEGHRLGLTAHAGIESIPVTANGVAAQAEFDLGNGSGVLISRALAERLELPVTGRTAGGGVGGEVVRDLVRLRSLTVAGRTFHDVTAAIDDQPNANDLNIGTSILRHFLITTDFAGRSVWLKPRESGERG